MSTTTIALVVGHRSGSPGAVSIGGVSEYDYNEPLAHMVADELTGVPGRPLAPRVVYRPDQRGGYAKLPSVVNATGADVCLSLHFNASANPAAHGTEALYATGSQRGEALARLVAEYAQRALGTTLRHPARGGAVSVGAFGRGGPLLHRTAMPCVIAEPAFGSNGADWLALKERRHHLAIAYARAIEAWIRAGAA